MNTPFDLSVTRDKLVLPGLAGFYENFAQPLGWVLLRLVLGGWLVHEGWPKLMAPLAQVQFVEAIGFRPGWLFSPLLAIVQVFGGLAIVLGLYTRPIAFANAIMLFITVWYHYRFPYNTAPLLTDSGIDAIKSHAEYLTSNGAKRLMDGGVLSFDLLQNKAVQLSSIWAFGCLFFAAFGGGFWSVDRRLKKTL